MRRLHPVVVGLAACLGIACCSTAYGPGTSFGRDGYTVRRIGAGHYEVSFTGNPNAGLQEVKEHVRRRAAEVTLTAGYSHFVVQANSAEAEISPQKDPFWNSENGFLSGTVKRGIGGAAANAVPYLGAGEADLNTRYTASSEIMMLKGAEAASNPDALSASDILQSLGRAGEPSAK